LAYKEIISYYYHTLRRKDLARIYHLLGKDNEYERCNLNLMREKHTKSVKGRPNLPIPKQLEVVDGKLSR
jgi:hypothetical protein